MEEVKNVEKVEEWHHIVTLEDLGDLKRKINVIYDAIGVQMAMDKAKKAASEQAQIKGFRKGKAPIKLIEKYYEEEITNMATDLLAQEGFLHACYEQKVQPLSKPEVEHVRFHLDGTFSCELILEVKPTIIPSGYVGLQLKKPEIDVNKIFEAMLEDIKMSHAVDSYSDRVELDSMIVVDYFVTCNSEIISNGKDQKFMIRKGQEPPFGENLLGMKISEVKTETTVIPEQVKEHSGKSAEITIVLKSVMLKQMPTNEDLVKKTNSPSYDVLLDMVKKQSEMEAKNREGQIVEEEIIDKLIGLHDFSVPKDWVVEERKYLVQQLKLNKEPDESLDSFLNQMAERNVRRAFILEAIYDSEQHHLAITKQEVDNVITQEAARANVKKSVVEEELKKKNMLDGIVGLIKHKKVLNYIVSQAFFTTASGEVMRAESQQSGVINNGVI